MGKRPTVSSDWAPRRAGVARQVKLNLSQTHPDLCKEADGWDPASYTSGSHAKVEWVCPQGHRWIAAISDSRETGCAVCSGRKVEVGLNDLSTTHPEIAAQAYGWDPKEIREKSGIIKSWRCHLGHVWRASTAMRTRGNGCPYCSGTKVLVGFNDLATTHPDLAATAVGWDPGQFSAGS